MNVLVIFTGGTIGSAIVDGWIAPDKTTKSELIYRYKTASGDNETVFVTDSPYEVLSENLSANELNSLIACLNAHLDKNYDGIIITHGTDTLQYSASALSYVTTNAKIPIILVSADYPLQDERSNGLDNFMAAVNFIRSQPKCAGVFVSYKNAQSSLVDIHLGSRLIAHMEACADMFSIDRQPFATCNNKTAEVSLNKNCSRSNSNAKNFGAVELCKKPNILFAESCPEKIFSYNVEKYSAVVMSPYHSGTLNTASENFQKFCLLCKQKNIPVFLVNANSGVGYKSSKLYSSLGIVVLPPCAKIAIFVKCWLALSLNKDIKKFVLSPLSDEFINE